MKNNRKEKTGKAQLVEVKHLYLILSIQLIRMKNVLFVGTFK